MRYLAVGIAIGLLGGLVGVAIVTAQPTRSVSGNNYLHRFTSDAKLGYAIGSSTE